MNFPTSITRLTRSSSTAHLPKNREQRSQSLKKYRGLTNEKLLEEDETYVQILIKREHLEELQSILTLQRNSKDITQGEIISLCGILADCGILDTNKEN